ncbi:MAG: biotin/lipoyl-containing protein [Candidatus Methanomethylicaceae archaeon]|nr:biotin/lipoyl-binding protein [Candidatus Verstraetearchaeota archaeon]
MKTSRLSKFQITIGNSKYDVNIQEKAYGIYEVKVNDEVFNINIIDMLSGQALTTTTPTTTSVQTVSGIPGSTAEVGGVIKAAMPGTVMTIKVKVGDVVKEGDVVLTLETMKMENPIKATRSGKIKEIKVQPGKFVNVGDPLIVIE